MTGEKIPCTRRTRDRKSPDGTRLTTGQNIRHAWNARAEPHLSSYPSTKHQRHTPHIHGQGVYGAVEIGIPCSAKRRSIFATVLVYGFVRPFSAWLQHSMLTPALPAAVAMPMRSLRRRMIILSSSSPERGLHGGNFLIVFGSGLSRSAPQPVSLITLYSRL